MTMGSKISYALESMILTNGGRWTEVTMKKTGEKLTVLRTGYKSFEDAMNDSFMVINEEGETLYESETLRGIGQWMQLKYC